jgi:glycosyltransferase involved in cell wall biosynthesis
VKRPRISVIVPTFNHGPFISDCLSSIVAQTHQAWEAVVLDNGSTDDTLDRARGIVDRRITVQSTPVNTGLWRLHETYNRALTATQGDFVAVLEGDDFWPASKLERALSMLDQPDVVLAYGITAAVSADGSPLAITLPSESVRRRFGRSALANDPLGSATRALLDVNGQCFIGISSVVIRRTALDSIGGFQHVQEFPGVDYPTFLELSLVGRFAFVDAVQAYWRRHPASSSWEYRQILRRGAEPYVRRFVAQNHERLALPDRESKRLLRAWQGRMDLAEGRSLLLEHRWEESRQWLAQAIRIGSATTRIAAALGVLASLLHLDIELAARAFGRRHQGGLVASVASRSPKGSTARHKAR